MAAQAANVEENESEDELFDIDLSNRDSIFYYNDPYIMSPQIRAVLDNDVNHLKRLIKKGKSVNIIDNNGNTPLHISVVKEKQKIFDYLVRAKDVRLDAQNFDGMTPLMQALVAGNDYFAVKLMNNGADVTVARNIGDTPLHYAADKDISIGKMIIEKGANINAQNYMRETPLHAACEKGNCDLVYMLLYYGADVIVYSLYGILPFTVALSHCPHEVQEILFDYTFDEEKVPVTLRMLETAMLTETPLFYKIIEKASEVIYDEDDLERLCTSLPKINPQLFRIFIERFENVAGYLFDACNVIADYVEYMIINPNEHPDFVNFFFVLCNSPVVTHAALNYNGRVFLAHSMITRHVPLETLTEVMCCLMSHGIDIIADDLNCVYGRYGFCELFEIMLHMEIAPSLHNGESNYRLYFIPIMIYNVKLDYNMCLEYPSKYIFASQLPTILKFFAHSKIKEHCSNKYRKSKHLSLMENSPQVPSLVELSRNASRKYIVNRFNIKNNVQFYTILKWLPINQIYKDILAFKKEIYNIQSSK